MTTRERILDAAAEAMRRLGLARATTKEIARAAGYSEATLYKHFQDKQELFTCVLTERLPQFVAVTKRLPGRVGTGTVRENLLEVTVEALAFYGESFPMAASIFAEPDLLAAARQSLRTQGAGPHKGQEALADYLRAEQRNGRVSRAVDADAAAALLLGACLYHAFLGSFYGHPLTREQYEALAPALVDTLTSGFAPDSRGT